MSGMFSGLGDNTKKTLNPNHVFSKEGRQAAADPLDMFKKPEGPKAPPPAPPPPPSLAAPTRTAEEEEQRRLRAAEGQRRASSFLTDSSPDEYGRSLLR